MLPEIRTSGEIFSIPKFDLDRNDVEGFVDILKGFHAEFRDCFAREEGRENFFYYSIGQFSQLERKSIEPMALNVEGAKVRAIQRFISEAAWDDEKMLEKYRCMVNDDMGEENGVLIIDESGFRKKGDESAGVYRQYCGNIGKVDNCQVGVFAGYASSQGYALLDKKLFVPEAWFTDEYEFSKRRVTIAKDGLPTREVWLVMKRTMGPNPSYSFYISNAPLSSRLALFVWLSGVRWPIEQCFEEGKSELGMDHYEVRKYLGWNHHMLICMLSHFFLWHLKIKLEKKTPAVTISQLRVLLQVILPLKTYDIDSALSLIIWVQLKNHRAYLSHRKKKLREDPSS